jgi:hypothetical protein
MMASALLARASSRSIRSSARLACQHSSVSLASSKRALPRPFWCHNHFSTSEQPQDASATPASLQTATLTTTTTATEDESSAFSASDKDLGVKRRISIYDMDYFRLRDIDNIQELESLVDQLEHMPTLTSEDIGPLLVPLTRRTCELGFGKRGAEITERVLFDCLSRLPPDYADRKPEHPYPVKTMYNRAIIAWGNLRTHEGAKRAEKIFQLMMSEYHQEAEWVRQQQQQQQQQPQVDDSSNVQTHLLKEERPFFDVNNEMVVRAEQPDRRCFKSLLRAWAISGAPNGPARAYEILLEMERLSDVSRVLQAIEQQKKLHEQQQNYIKEQTPLGGVGEKTGPNVNNDGSVVPFGVVNNDGGVVPSPFEKPKDGDSASPLLSIERPDQGCYNSVLSAYAKAFVLKHPHALNRIKQLIARMHALYEATGDEEYTLDWISYHAVLRAYSKYAAYSADPLDRSFVEEVEDILRQIDRDEQRLKQLGKLPLSANLSMPWAYGVAIEAWTKTLPLAEGVQRADDIVMALLGKKKLENLPDPGLGWARQDNIIQVVRTWQRSGLPESEERIERLLRVVVESPYERIHFLHVSMETWTKSDWDFAPEVIEKMLEWSFTRMESYHCRPTGQTFMIAIKAWLRSKSEGAPYRAELILQKLVQIYEQERDPYYKPREIHLRYVITAWMNRAEDGRRFYGLAGNMYPAEHVEGLLALYGNADWNDNVHGLYAMAIRTWAKQRVAPGESEPNPLRRSVALLNEVSEITGSMDAYACNWVLEACCRRQQTMERRKEAYDIAMDTFSRGKRNPRTFVLLMKVLRAQIPVFDQPQQQLVDQLFNECCKSGYLSQDMVWEVASIATENMLHKMFKVSYQYAGFVVQSRDNRAGGPVSAVWTESPPTSLLVQNLPKQWSVRVKDNPARPQGAKK